MPARRSHPTTQGWGNVFLRKSVRANHAKKTLLLVKPPVAVAVAVAVVAVAVLVLVLAVAVAVVLVLAVAVAVAVVVAVVLVLVLVLAVAVAAAVVVVLYSVIPLYPYCIPSQTPHSHCGFTLHIRTKRLR